MTGAAAGDHACTVHKLMNWEERESLGGGERVAHIACFSAVIKCSGLTLEGTLGEGGRGEDDHISRKEGGGRIGIAKERVRGVISVLYQWKGAREDGIRERLCF